MRRTLVLLVAIGLLTPGGLEAQRRGRSSGGSVRVRSYSTRSGHTVRSYTRHYAGTAPRATTTTRRSTVRSTSGPRRSTTPAYRAPRSRTPRTTVRASYSRPRTARRAVARPVTRAPIASSGAQASAGVRRNTRDRIARSASARAEFMRRTGYPHGRPGYVVDHIRPLACGGADSPSNMQWQTVEQGKAKDRVERKSC